MADEPTDLTKAKTAPDLLKALQEITDHFADVLSGPRFEGVKFANGVEGIPTIKAARAAIAKATPQ